MRATLLLLAVAAPDGWHQLPALPDREGVAGAFAGVSGGALLVAGGANFPGKKPWEGGTKTWTDAAFVLTAPDATWKPAGTLPRPLGYGVSATHRGGVVCAGGSDRERHHSDVFRLEWKGKLHTSPLPPLPRPVAYGCGALVGETLYVIGGQDAPDALASKAVFALDLSAAAPRWVAGPELPTPRILATAAVLDGKLYVVGGCELVRDGDRVTRRYLRDGYRLDPTGWKRLADLPRPSAAAPSPAPTDGNGFFLLGGDDGSQVQTAPERHPGFPRSVLRYEADRWAVVGEQPAPRVTVPCVRWAERWVIPSGEMRPGVRSPQVWAFR